VYIISFVCKLISASLHAAWLADTMTENYLQIIS